MRWVLSVIQVTTIPAAEWQSSCLCYHNSSCSLWMRIPSFPFHPFTIGFMRWSNQSMNCFMSKRQTVTKDTHTHARTQTQAHRDAGIHAQRERERELLRQDSTVNSLCPDICWSVAFLNNKLEACPLARTRAHTHTHTTPFFSKSSTQHLLHQRKEDTARSQRFGMDQYDNLQTGSWQPLECDEAQASRATSLSFPAERKGSLSCTSSRPVLPCCTHRPKVLIRT